MTITTTHKLLTRYWTAAVAALETGVEHFDTDSAKKNDCRISFFETGQDDRLHVNITHRYPTKSAQGWAGPANLPEGFVHNRTFGDTQPSQIIRHVRDMVFASRIRQDDRWSPRT